MLGKWIGQWNDYDIYVGCEVQKLCFNVRSTVVWFHSMLGWAGTYIASDRASDVKEQVI